jgi:3',5'-cyclic AMP phosphodiesterase CpdA
MNHKYRLLIVTIFSIIILFSSNLTSIAIQQKNSISTKEKPFNQIKPDILNNFTFSKDFNILYPRSSNPVIVEKGGNFTIDFQTESFDNISAYISTAYEPIVNDIELLIYDIKETNGVWHAIVNLPYNTQEELYNITIIIEQNGRFSSENQPRAVSVIDEISDNFSFVHLSDFHIGDPRGLKENIKQTIGWKAAKKCIDEINLINPDFLIITGDLVFGQMYPFEYSLEYKKCYEILQMFQVPTYLIPGNHDGYLQCGQDGFKFWKKYFGPLYYSFDYGNHHFTCVNSYDWPKINRFGISFLVFNWGGSIQEEQIEWIKEDLKDNNAKLNFMCLHHNPIWDTEDQSLFKSGYKGRQELLKIIEEYGIDAVFSGHEHYDNVTYKNDTIYITTTTASSDTREDSYWGYRIIEINNSQIVSYNYKEPHYSIPSYRLNYTYVDFNKAVVENDLEKNITAHLKFLLTLGNYSVENGDIFLER